MAQLQLPRTVGLLLAGNRGLAAASQRAISGNSGTWGTTDQGASTSTADSPTRKIHLGRVSDYPQVAALPLPDNIDPNETIQFSPSRTRDIACQQISLGQYQPIDVTCDSSANSYASSYSSSAMDPRMASYDAHATVHLNAHMQSNVPEPFGQVGFSHLNMPGGQWAQNGKFMAQDLQASHYTNLRQQVRSDWDKKGVWTVTKRSFHHSATNSLVMRQLMLARTQTNPVAPRLGVRHFSVDKEKVEAKVEEPKEAPAGEKPAESKKMQLKKAFKEYGSTVVVFHVGMSLMSLGMFYTLVSSGLDVMKIVEYFNMGDSVLASKVGTGAGTFVVAYAVHKVFAPVRISITLGATPFLVRMMRKRGILKK